MLCFKYGNNVKNFSSSCDGCNFYLRCTKALLKENGTYKLMTERNVVVNDWGNGKMEVVMYKHGFPWLADHENLEGEVKRNFFVHDCPVYGRLLIPYDERTRITDLMRTLDDSSKRAQDNFYGYAHANEWKYFFTFTFDPKKVGSRYDDDEIIYLWRLFREKLQRFDPDVKILCVKERHEDGALHFHGLIDTEKDFTLRLHYENGKPKLSKLGDPLFEFDFWDYGRHTLAILPKDGNYDAAINYLITYTTKQSNIGFGKKRFFRTRNLNCKTKFVTNWADAQDIIMEAGLKQFKENDKVTVLRNFNMKEEAALTDDPSDV